jgi:hypothetical protein
LPCGQILSAALLSNAAQATFSDELVQ